MSVANPFYRDISSNCTGRFNLHRRIRKYPEAIGNFWWSKSHQGTLSCDTNTASSSSILGYPQREWSMWSSSSNMFAVPQSSPINGGLRESSINGGFSIAMFDYQRVIVGTGAEFQGSWTTAQLAHVPWWLFSFKAGATLAFRVMLDQWVTQDDKSLVVQSKENEPNPWSIAFELEAP